jgi:hypothetical protein
MRWLAHAPVEGEDGQRYSVHRYLVRRRLPSAEQVTPTDHHRSSGVPRQYQRYPANLQAQKLESRHGGRQLLQHAVHAHAALTEQFTNPVRRAFRAGNNSSVPARLAHTGAQPPRLWGPRRQSRRQYTRKQSARGGRSKHTAPQCGITSPRNSSDRISRTVPNSGAGIEVAPFVATVDPFSSRTVIRSTVHGVNSSADHVTSNSNNHLADASP